MEEKDVFVNENILMWTRPCCMSTNVSWVFISSKDFRRNMSKSNLSNQRIEPNHTKQRHVLCLFNLHRLAIRRTLKIFPVSRGAPLRGQGGRLKKRRWEWRMWKATVESSSAHHPSLAPSFYHLSVTSAVHSIWFLRKYHLFTRSSCPWQLLFWVKSNCTTTVTVPSSLHQKLSFRCKQYLSNAERRSWINSHFKKWWCSVPVQGHNMKERAFMAQQYCTPHWNVLLPSNK